MRLYLPNGLLKRADADLSDLTAARRTGEPYWDPDEVDVLVVPMDREPPEAEQAAIRRRLVTADADEEQMLHDLRAERAAARTSFQRLWLTAELARYGETV